MNTKLLLKVLFLLLMLLLLVMMGMYNRREVEFILPPLIKKQVTQPAALMYFAFFAVGLVTGTVLTAGTGRKSGGSPRSGKS